MTIRYICEECGAALNINDELAGTSGSCPRCQVEFTVPGGAAEPAVAKTSQRPAKLPGDPLSDDDIGDILNSSESRSASSGYGAASPADDELDDAEEEKPRSRKKKDRFDEEDLDDEVDDAPPRDKKQKGSKPAAPQGDSAHSADIARHLMGRGEKPAVEESEKKSKRPFGGQEHKREGELTSLKDVATYFAKIGWPFALIMVSVIGLCTWFYISMQKTLDLPPLAQVAGRVTVAGKPLNSAIVKFVPEEGTKNLRLATSIGITDKDGNYSLMYAADVAGAVIGKHQVQVQLNDPTGTQLIAPEYSTARSTLTAEVKKGAPPYNFDIPSVPAGTTSQ
jgi:hypothetical protein